MLLYLLIFFVTVVLSMLAVKFISPLQSLVCPGKAQCNCPATFVKPADAKKTEMYQNY
jgi:hypothetical protein